jgi:hypothetical protein
MTAAAVDRDPFDRERILERTRAVVANEAVLRHMSIATLVCVCGGLLSGIGGLVAFPDNGYHG